ncbi:probable LRR receptor-like serine/threonine-protein kinase At1g56140 isoform X2 [Hibiscus syriacus]|uniref:probable LRR receptor-like serine/threonine-protein kinase At1g56140 isoform X2 n=1 Tax=Hibiscus syriacus TaxID=106335 RepID=UPI001924AB1F|nr:probable LRR receptor-like serine/threonine-protein kinase At1g56140 isoform X2 [Hibiscus syriacus]
MISKCLFLVVLFSWSQSITAQNATTDPKEVRALNSILQQWDAQAADSWNISGEPCSGTSLSQDDTVFGDGSNNPSIRCDCSFNNKTLCHITRLRVYALDKRGEMPKELLDLPFLTFLSIAYNNFSGPIPKELGNLKELYLLSFGVNHFSGTLPPELGNLVNLEQLYINSCGLGGHIPSTFAKLQNLQVVGASDSPFTGKIPDFVGNNWTKLTSLRFEGNSFEGPIPSSFANLTKLTSLRISDIYNGSSSLDFVRNLKNLTDLVLRNVLLSGSLPSYITELQSLQKLDLSFNNLTGQIPSVLFNMDSLIYLFLGNNSLSGFIPSRKSDSLRTIDLSYNFLSGNLPSWVNSGLQLNLVANNFTLTSSNIRILPGLDCLQRSFPCNRNAPRYSSFSIKCGGPEMISDGVLFETDNSFLGAAIFNVTSKRKWAISNVGLFAERQNQRYVETNSGPVRSTNTPDLYRSSRLSPGSLRYYGLGLENGPYTVRLFFAEIGFPDQTSQSWRSLARRVFDVYIQGNRILRDFDITKEAGGAQRAITRNFTANVTGNHLEVHLFWAGKGTCCAPEPGYYGPSISAIRVTPNFRPTVNEIPSGNHKKNHTALIAGVTVPALALALILIFAVIYVKRNTDDDDEEVLLGISPRPNTFSYSELKAATEDFSSSKKLGEGGFGPVYKGTLSDGKVVAVKQLSLASTQGKEQFFTEIATISAVQHRNLVKLYGCCIGGNRRLLVYEYHVNKSLDQALWGKNALHLNWPTRFNICLSTARGLAYLHEESRLRVVHRDVKASNILLDAKLCPKISDFGLAKLYDDNDTHMTTRAAGTIGYLAPEYAMRGHLSEKVDVFSFGVVALEIMSGRPNSDKRLEDDRVYLLEWVWTLNENNQLLSLLDPQVTEFDENEALRVIGVALLCTQASPSMRPPMSRVVSMLAGDIEVSTVTTKPSYLTDWDYKDVTGTLSTVASDRNGSEIESKGNTFSGEDDQPMLYSVVSCRGEEGETVRVSSTN